MSKLNPVPAQAPAFDPNDDRYWDPRDLEQEMRRQLDVCHNCRMCVGYCGTFPDVFARVERDIEKHDASGAERLDADDFASATDLCWQCKLCYVKCPYTRDEGHAWVLDIPRLLMREKAQRARRNGIALQDRVLGEPQLLGKMTAGPMARVANFVNANRLVRKAAEKVAGISAEFPLPPFGTEAFASWLARSQPLPEAGSRGTVALFATCVGDYNFPNIAASAVRVLQKNGWSVVRPEQTCCGMPNLDGGDIDAAKAKARANVEALVAEVKQGRKIVSIQPTCGYTIRKEWPELLGTEDAKVVAAATVDVMELLDQQRRTKTLSTDYAKGAGRIAYHAACHLRAQKIGYPAVRVLSTLPDTEVEVIERCSAVDGTWGMKAQYYEMGRRYAQKLTREIDAAETKFVTTDCALAARRIMQENHVSPSHPVEVLAEAYGLAPELR
jgi:glycerol-3-phosphate dehydrogenase subunit C